MPAWSASTNASAAGVYQSPGRNHTDATLADSHERSNVLACPGPALVTSCVMPNERAKAANYDALHTDYFSLSTPPHVCDEFPTARLVGKRVKKGH